jgi:hypothetical protein
MRDVMKTAIIEANKPSEIIPLLGEALLLYDKVFLDITHPNTLEILNANMNTSTLEELLESGILELVVPEKFFAIALPEANLQQLITANINLSETLRDISFLKKEYKAIFSEALIHKIRDSIYIPKINYEQLLHNSYSDYNNIEFLNLLGNYVSDYFGVSRFSYTPETYGLKIVPETHSQNEIDKILQVSSYGLHLIAETNYKLALSNHFSEIICENDMMEFYKAKLKYSYRDYKHEILSENFIQLCEIHEFPNIKEAVSTRLLTIEQIIKMRNGNGRILREWLDSVTNRCIKERIEFSKECARLFTQDNSIPLPTRAVIFGFLQTLSFIAPYKAVLASAGYEFLVPKIVNDWKPRLFFDKARKKHINLEKIGKRKLV